MSELVERALKEHLCKDVDGAMFYLYLHRNGSKPHDLSQEVKQMIEKYGLSVSEAKGFCEYMKFAIEASSYLRQTK